MDGLKGPRATWLAVLGTGLSSLHGLINVASSISIAGLVEITSEQSLLLLISIASVLSSMVWCWLFVAFYRERRGLSNPVAPMRVIVLALLLVLVPRALVLGLQAYSSILFDALGIFTVVVAALAIIVWAALLWTIRSGLTALDFKIARIERLAFWMAVLIVCQSLPAINAMVSGLMSMVKGSLMLAWHSGALGALLWRQAITPAVNLFYWVSQMIFLLALKEDADGVLSRSPVARDGLLAEPFSSPTHRD